MLASAVVLAGAFVLASTDAADPDLWGHVRYGQDALALGRLPRTATHTFTAAQQPWINHEILSELVFGFVAAHAGGPGLLVLKAVLGLGVVAAIARAAARQGANAAVSSAVVLLVSINLAPGWTVRPQLFTWVAFAILTWLLERDSRTPVGEAPSAVLWLAVPLFTFWANTHGGFVAGFCLFGLYLGIRIVEIVWVRGRAHLREAAPCALLLATAGAATIVNPYGVELLRWLAYDLGPPRPEISEWAGLGVGDLRFVPFVALVALAVVGWIARHEPRDHVWAALLMATAVQSIGHVRHVPFFAILAGFWLPGQLEALWRSRRGPSPSSAAAAPAALRTIRAALGITVVMLAIALAVQCRTLWVSRALYPVAAFQYMAAHRITGRLVVHFDWSQYAIAAFAPETTVAFDGRFRTCYPQELADMHFDFILGDVPERWRSPTSPPFDPGRVLEFGRPDLVLVSRRYERSVAVMEQHTDWVLLYQDGLAQLWGRRSEYDDARSPRHLPDALRVIGDAPQAGEVAWPALPVPAERAAFSPGVDAGRTAG